ncbi:hypothetical protein [uncultured Hoeflea sp.]|uniref:hypothetical protein n=1 Tax=uncultured Hoeflea sp. TaxID=538666 RepID=UPI00261AF0FB|nr:hypothetical protein [uncultured Hoeflea sp.]
MKTIFIATVLSLATLGVASAASVTNKDAESRVLIVTEGSDTVELVIEAGATVSFCPAGCFVTMPSGDREALSGSETIDIVDNQAVIK